MATRAAVFLVVNSSDTNKQGGSCVVMVRRQTGDKLPTVKPEAYLVNISSNFHMYFAVNNLRYKK